ncbi:SDR family oxidoreductase [Streptomyces californicus]
MRLTGKTVVVTGAARGLGRATAEACAAEGADLALLDLCDDLPGVPYPLGTAGQLEHTAELCRKAGSAVLTARCDVRDLRSVEEAVALAEERFGALDGVVNNAGIAAPSGRPAHEIGEEEWALMIDVDLPRGLADDPLRRRGDERPPLGQHRQHRLHGGPGGLPAPRRVRRREARPHRARQGGGARLRPGRYGSTRSAGSVRDDPTAEGRMLAEIARALDVPVSEHEQEFVAAQPMNALIEPADVAAAVVYLLSDDARQVTGTTLTVDGGFSAR